MVLPEHRGVMKGWQRERSMREQRTLSEDEIENIQYVVSDAIQNSASVRLTLFGMFGDTMLEGILIYDGR